MRVIATESSKDVLCKYCRLEFPTCPKANHIRFGDGVGNDNVIECSEFVVKTFHNNFPITGRPQFGVIPRAEAGRNRYIKLERMKTNIEWAIKNCCPKCSCQIIGGNLKKHIKNCKSTFVADAVKAISDRIDKEIMDSLISEATK